MTRVTHEPRQDEYNSSVRFMEELLREHELIEQVVGSLLAYSEELRSGGAPSADGLALVRFFRVYAGGLHHAREENVLFPALVNEAMLPGKHGPIAALLIDHHEMAEMLNGMEEILSDERDAEAGDRFRSLAYTYANRLLAHIDAENSVLIPEAEARLNRAGVRELETREPDADELAMEASGRALVARYTPIEDPDMIRGEGCIMCASYGVHCEGLEREWWNEYEWAESDDHNEAG